MAVTTGRDGTGVDGLGAAAGLVGVAAGAVARAGVAAADGLAGVVTAGLEDLVAAVAARFRAAPDEPMALHTHRKRASRTTNMRTCGVFECAKTQSCST